MKKLSARAAALEAMGIDTTKFNMEMNGVTLSAQDIESASTLIEDKQINNKAFRRWITAQTFKMLEYPKGWDAYLRDHYDYKYQFSMMLEEVKVLSKLEKKDPEEFRERSHFFNYEVVIDTCRHYIKQMRKYVEEHKSEDGKVKLAKFGNVDVESLEHKFYDKLENIIADMYEAENYSDLYTELKKFIKKMNKLPDDTPKCSEWKDAFKGSGAYYSLKNMILFHGVVLKSYGCTNKEESIEYLERYTNNLQIGDLWRIHMMLKKVIAETGFDLRTSIARNK